MKANIGNIDRLVRLAAALIITFLFIFKLIPGIAGLILLVVAAIFLLTSIAGTCPLYSIFGITTRFKKRKEA
ncbi:MAG TPA: DUF2892 domain-containing protein [Chitinophagaceae bacterium]|nr:DUF2892 domain-containing protein [Chitinophagaceae bacterium]